MSKLVFIFCLILCFFSCQKSDSFLEIEVVGHAGSGLDVERNPCPPNTQEAINFGLTLGLKNIEIDLQLTRDNHWVLFHDDYLQRKTNFSGSIRQFNLEEIYAIRYQGYPNIGIPALTEIDFNLCNQVFLDIRQYDPSANFSLIAPELMHEEIINLIANFPNTTFFVVCRDALVLQHFANLNVPICQEVFDYDEMIQSHNVHGFDFFQLRNSKISATQVNYAQNLGLKVLIYGIKSHDGNIAALRKKPNFVMTDAVSSAVYLTN